MQDTTRVQRGTAVLPVSDPEFDDPPDEEPPDAELPDEEPLDEELPDDSAIGADAPRVYPCVVAAAVPLPDVAADVPPDDAGSGWASRGLTRV